MFMMTNLAAEPTELCAAAISGFTPGDLAVLDQMRASALSRRFWNRAELVRDQCLDYLAVWDARAESSETPSLAIIRFKKSGTYAMTVGSTVVATASTLPKILPPLPSPLSSPQPLPTPPH